jgi:uncharacterized repeat protein (TIGR02543 family)
MKKFLFALMAVCLTFAMIGCDKDNGGGGTPSVTITFDLDWPTAATGTPGTKASITIDKDGTLSADQLLVSGNQIPSGYVFDVWLTDADDTSSVVVAGSTTFPEDITLTATWDESIDITRNYNWPTDAKGSKPTNQVVPVAKGKAIGSAAANATGTYVPRGWTFSSWNTAQGGGASTAVTSASSYTADTIIYAQWTDVRVEVEFYTNDTTTAKETVKAPIGTYVGDYLPAKPVRTGYEFFGWGSTETLDTTVEGSTAVYGLDLSGVAIAGGEKYYARWYSDVLTDDSGGTAEKLALDNGSHAVYQFTIADTSTWSDYTKVSVTYKVSEASLKKQARSMRLMGNYKTTTAKKADNDVYVFQFDDHNADYIMDNVSGLAGTTWKWGDKKIGAIAADPDKTPPVVAVEGPQVVADTWFTIEYDISGTKAHGSFKAANMPGDAETGPFFLGIGIASLESPASGDPRQITDYKGVIVQLVKDIKLTNDDGSLEVLGTADGFGPAEDKSAIAGYLHPINFSWRGAPADPVVVPFSVPIVLENLSFEGWGSVGGQTGNEFTFARLPAGDGTAPGAITADLPEELLTEARLTTFTVFYTIERTDTGTDDMKVIFSPRAKDSWSGATGDAYSADHSADGDYSKDGLLISNYQTGKVLTIMQNDNSGSLTSTFKIKITKIEFR